MNKLKQSIAKMAEREKASNEQIVDVFLSSIEKAYKSYKSIDDSSLLKVSFEDEDFFIENEKMKFSLKSFEKDRKFLDLCSEEVSKKLKILRAEREYKYFYPLKNQIVGGFIQNIGEYSKYCIVNLENGLGYWDKKEWKFFQQGENFRIGMFLRFIVLDVEKENEITKVFLSRAENCFVEKIFEIEIPEIKNKFILIEKVIRIPGLISKVVLKGSQENEKIDIIGACIGKNKIRIKTITKEIGKERIDLCLWESDKKKILMNLLSPAEIISVLEKEKNFEVIVPESKMSLILQNSGKVIKKIEEYLDIKIKVKSFEIIQSNGEVVIWNGNITFSEYNNKNSFNNNFFKDKKL